MKTYRIGETIRANNGLNMTIVVYRNNHDIDVMFEDGVIVTHKTYYSFTKGLIKHPNIDCVINKNKIKHIGETSKASNGQMMTIIVYRNCLDIDIEFEDGTIVQHKSYNNFQKGQVKNPNVLARRIPPTTDRIGETLKMKCGLTAKIVDYRNTHDIDILLENGDLVTHKSYDKFIKGSIYPTGISSHTYLARKVNVGKTNTMNNGLVATIKEYYNNCSIDVLFETGYIAKDKKISNFYRSNIGHPFPYQLGTIIIEKPAYIYNNVGNFYCTCTKCGYKDILTMDEIKNHKCIERNNNG